MTGKHSLHINDVFVLEEDLGNPLALIIAYNINKNLEKFESFTMEVQVHFLYMKI